MAGSLTDTGVRLATGEPEQCGSNCRRKVGGGGGAVKRAIIDLVLISGPCVLDPLQDRMTVFGFVLARDKND